MTNRFPERSFHKQQANYSVLRFTRNDSIQETSQLAASEDPEDPDAARSLHQRDPDADAAARPLHQRIPMRVGWGGDLNQFE